MTPRIFSLVFACVFLAAGCSLEPDASITGPLVEVELSTSLIRAGTVSDLTVRTESETILIVRWTQVDDGTGNPAFHRLKYAESPLTDWKSAATVCTPNPRGSSIGDLQVCGISGLKPGTSYDFQLMSFRYQDGRWVGAEYSNIATGTTHPSPVDDLEVVAATASTLTLRWTQVQDGRGEPAFYRVRFGSPLDVWKNGTIGCDREIQGTEIGAEMTCTVEGLDLGSSYELQLYSYYYDDDGKWAAARASNKTTGTTVDTGMAGSGRIAFTRGGDGISGIYVMNADGTEPTLLTEGGGSPAWSSDGSRIAFEGWYDDVYVMNADGSGVTNLTNSIALSAWMPAWSPDGSRIAFVSDRDFEEIGEIYVMNADGTGQTRLTYDGQGAYEPEWSPDGSKIVFTNDRDGDIEAFDNHEIFVMNADGSGQTNLTNFDGHDQGPAWSPDGTRIAFASNREGSLDIYVMNADGTGVVRLTDSPETDLYPAWSPDGTRIAFQAQRDLDWEIFVMNADGSGQTNVTNREGFDGAPAWEP
jgi:TolB protein